MPKHIPGRGPYFMAHNSKVSVPVDTELVATRTRTKSEPEITVTDSKSRKTTKVPRITWAARITPAKGA